MYYIYQCIKCGGSTLRRGGYKSCEGSIVLQIGLYIQYICMYIQYVLACVY